uniref:PepSY-associated TM helix domain protein n=1 Tax=Rhodopseudomonas palustris (strain BisA53) TaxID=316055 RepID=Q07HU1_RHOP5
MTHAIGGHQVGWCGELMSDGRRIADHETKKRRAFWFRQLYQWHWISSGLCLVGMVLFAATGITLNHAGQIESAPRVQTRDVQLPPAMRTALKAQPSTGKTPLPTEISQWLQRELGVRVADRDTEWSAKDVYVALPRPGGDAWLSIDRGSGDVTYELTDRGWIAYLNDLHKGRHTGTAWSWFLDLFAAAAIIFCLTGLLLLQLHAPRRPSTWPVVGLGFVLPVLLLVLFIHR